MTALGGGQPDEVPISLSIGPTNAQRWVGRSDWQGVYQAHRMVGSIPTYGHKGSPIPKPYWREGFDETIQVEIVRGKTGFTIQHRRISTPLGTLTSQERIDYLEYGAGQTLEPLIKTRDDYEIYLAYVEEWSKCVELEESHEVMTARDEIGDEGVWVWWITHTFYQPFWVLRRVQDYLLDFCDVPELMREVIQATQKINRRYLQAFNDSPCQVLICNLSGASSSIVSPGFFREWVMPELKWLVSNAHAGKFIGFHLTGKIRAIFPMLMEAQPHFVLRFESPRFGGDCALREAKAAYGDQLCLMGGHDPHIFVWGSLEEMRQEAIRCIDEAAAGGGYILDNTDAVPEGARMEDVRATVQAGKAYGKY